MIKYESILSLDVRRKDGCPWPEEFEKDEEITDSKLKKYICKIKFLRINF